VPGRGITLNVTTTREVLRHVLHILSLDRLIIRRRIAHGIDVGHGLSGDRRDVFSSVYDQAVWLIGRAEGSRSGLGSEVRSTAGLRENLAGLLGNLGARSLLDVGCGDFTWMQHVDLSDIEYTGIDIVQSVIAADIKEFAAAGRRFLCLDAVEAALPGADVVLCREVLFHLSFADSQRLVANIVRSGAKHLIATSDSGTGFNADIKTGDFRVLNLRKRPYRLPQPLAWIADDSVLKGRALGVWAVSDICPLPGAPPRVGMLQAGRAPHPLAYPLAHPPRRTVQCIRADRPSRTPGGRRTYSRSDRGRGPTVSTQPQITGRVR
jgi:SAM-dependent methyltransferase